MRRRGGAGGGLGARRSAQRWAAQERCSPPKGRCASPAARLDGPFPQRRAQLTPRPLRLPLPLLPPPPPPPPRAAIALNPEGRESYEAHVKVPTELAARFPLSPDGDEELLRQVAAEDAIDKQ